MDLAVPELHAVEGAQADEEHHADKDARVAELCASESCATLCRHSVSEPCAIEERCAVTEVVAPRVCCRFLLAPGSCSFQCFRNKTVIFRGRRFAVAGEAVFPKTLVLGFHFLNRREHTHRTG